MSIVSNHFPEILDDVNGRADDDCPARKPRPKPARFIRLCVRPDGAAPGVVRITVGAEATDYFLYAVPADFGRGFRLEKIGPEGKDDHYHVNLAGARSSCECKGFCRHGRPCKHIDGLATLVKVGRL